MFFFFFFKQKTAYEMRISDWSSDVCSSDLFALTPVNARHIGAPLILECLANIECKVIDIVERHSIVVLQGVAAYIDETREEKRMIHAIGDGTFVADGRRFDRKEIDRKSTRLNSSH